MKTYNEEQFEIFRSGGKILAQTFEVLEKMVKPGTSTLDLDKAAEEFIRSQDATPSFKGYKGFEYSICTSVNDCIIHGYPRADVILKEGDIISIDVGVRYKGLCTDAARTFPVGKISNAAKELITITENCFWEAFEHLREGIKPKEIGAIIERYIQKNPKYEIVKGQETYEIIDNFFGHGIGEDLHQDPLIPNYKPRKKVLIQLTNKPIPAGCVICIEPMITQGSNKNRVAGDKWSVFTVDGKLSAHYENTVIIHEDGAEVITMLESF